MQTACQPDDAESERSFRSERGLPAPICQTKNRYPMRCNDAFRCSPRDDQRQMGALKWQHGNAFGRLLVSSYKVGLAINEMAYLLELRQTLIGLRSRSTTKLASQVLHLAGADSVNELVTMQYETTQADLRARQRLQTEPEACLRRYRSSIWLV